LSHGSRERNGGTSTHPWPWQIGHSTGYFAQHWFRVAEIRQAIRDFNRKLFFNRKLIFR
jgi:hypothetical protein